MRDEIVRTTKPVAQQMMTISVVGLVLFFLAPQIFKYLGRQLDAALSNIVLAVRFIILGSIILGWLLTWLNARREKYYMTENILIIIQTSGSSQFEQTYNLNDINSISISQSFIAKTNDYGHIHIELNNPSAGKLALYNVVNPQLVVSKINARRDVVFAIPPHLKV